LNLNSFVAHLKREDLIHGTIFAVSELREALEDKNTVREVANYNIAVASEWIVRTGMQLYKEARNGEPLLDDDPSMKITGPLYEGKPGLCLERWLFWKSQFSRVTDEVDEEVAQMAQQAAGEMERVEKVMRKRAMDLSTGETHHRLKSF
jgi:Protein of unknown function (DUF3632)